MAFPHPVITYVITKTISGNIALERMHKLKSLNIDYISSGDLTKNISAADYSLIFKTID